MSAATVDSTPFSTEPIASSSTVGEMPAGEYALPVQQYTSPMICRYFLRGSCRYGAMCRFSHDFSGGEVINSYIAKPSTSNTHDPTQPIASSSKHISNWVNAPVFIPKGTQAAAAVETLNQVEAEETEGRIPEGFHDSTAGATDNRTWADVVGSNAAAAGITNVTEPCSSVDMICPYANPCPYGEFCQCGIHLELCKMCDQYCLHPTDQVQRRKHNQECLQQHEQAMELSFAIARSKDKTCGICFDTIMEKSGREKRFGILPNCNHIFCLECIRKWRQAKQFEHKITRSCPECRVSSDFVCPSAFWVETKEEKDKLLGDYRTALGIKDCKYFKKGDGKCPFGNKCFYKHALPDGKLVDVGFPKRPRKMQRSTNEVIDLLDIYLWEFVDQRDYHWLDLFSSLSDDSDDSDWSE